jgi:hypothetical protein
MGIDHGTLKLIADDQRRLKEMAAMYGPSREMLAQVNSMGPAVKLIRETASALEQVRGSSDQIVSTFGAASELSSRLAAGMSIAHGARAALLTQLELPHIPPDLVTGIRDWSTLRGGLDDMLGAQRALFESLQIDREMLVPSFVIEWPPLGILTHTELLSRLATPTAPAEVEGPGPERAEEEREELADDTEERLLKALEARPALRDEWLAAGTVLRSTNPRRARYFCVSIRQLFSRILDDVAPVKVVAAWAEANGSKEETRARTRFSYVASTFPNDHFAAYVVKDSDEMFKAWDLASTLVHQSEPSESMLLALERRAAVWILGILTTSRNRGN